MFLRLALLFIFNFLIGDLMGEEAIIVNRQKVDAKYKWNKENMYASERLWQSSFEKMKKSKNWDQLASYQNKLGDNSETLKKALDLSLTMDRRLGCLLTYASLWKDEDLSNDRAAEAFSNIEALNYTYNVKTVWIEPEIISLPSQTMARYLKDPVLKEYRFYLENRLRWKKHTLSMKQEELLAKAQKPLDTPERTFSALNGLDVTFQPVKDSAGKLLPLTHGSYYVYIKSPDRTLRKNAFENLCRGFEKMENTCTQLLSGHVQKHIFNSRSTHFKNSLDSALFKNNINPEVYTNLLKTVKANRDVLHRFVRLKKRILKLKDFHFYDLNAPIVTGVDFKMNVEEAKKVVLKAVAVLGKEYQERLSIGLNQERWIDYFENKNKRPGGYSSGCYDSYPYILLNFHGSLNDVSTLAHEAGHSMQSEMVNKNQPYIYSGYSIFIAEIASTFNEQLLMDYLLAQTKDQKRKAFLIASFLDHMQATFFRQTLFADFELRIHQMAEKGEPLTLTLLKDIYKKLYQEYYGPDLIVDDLVSIEWARVPHFYANFYVYQYATGIAAAVAYIEAIKKDKKNCQEYLTFLKSGNSRYPLNLLKSTGVDLTKTEPIEAFIKRFEKLMDQLEELELTSQKQA